MSDWEVAFFRAVGLLWFCLAQTGEAGDSLGLFWIFGCNVWDFGVSDVGVSDIGVSDIGLCDFGVWDFGFGLLVFRISVFGIFVFGILVYNPYNLSSYLSDRGCNRGELVLTSVKYIQVITMVIILRR